MPQSPLDNYYTTAYTNTLPKVHQILAQQWNSTQGDKSSLVDAWKQLQQADGMRQSNPQAAYNLLQQVRSALQPQPPNLLQHIMEMYHNLFTTQK